MTLRLILTRHAKSSWDSPNQPDHERPLNARGRKAAAAIGAWLESRGYVPELILCSTATRTMETCELMTASWQAVPETDYVKELYHAAPEQMLEVLEGYETKNVLMIGHNPGISHLAATLARTPPPNERFAVYPTGATTVFDFAQDSWAEIGVGKGAVRDFVVPRELEP